MSVWKDKKRGTWTAKFKFRGRQYKREGFATRSEALKWETDERERLQNPATPRTLTAFSTVSTAYLDYCSARMRPNTWRQKVFVFRSFLSHLQHDPPAVEVTKAMIADYLEARRRRSGNTAANRDLRELKALYNWAMKQEEFGIGRNPCLGIDKYPEEPKPRYVPPAEDIHRVLLAAEQEDLDLLLCLYHTGGRIGEILRLTWDDMNFERETVRLWTRKRRGGELEADVLPMSPTLKEMLRRRWVRRNKNGVHVFCKPSGAPYTYQDKRNVMKRLCRKAGVREFGFHAIRHHVASILEDSGKATLGQIQKFLRHRRRTTTEAYLHSLGRDQREVARILESAYGVGEEKVEGSREERTPQRTPFGE